MKPNLDAKVDHAVPNSMIFLSKQRSHLIRQSVLIALCCLLSDVFLSAQVKDLPVESKSSIKEKEPALTSGRNLIQANLAPLNKTPLTKALFPASKSPVLNQRVRVEISPLFRDQKFNATVRKFDQLMEKEIESADQPSDIRNRKFIHTITLVTSTTFDQKSCWQAYLQRTDFEMMADRLSLNDINRFQFRKNRENGDNLPAKTASGPNSPQLDHP